MKRAELLKEISELASILNGTIEQRGGENKIVYDKYLSHFLNSQLKSQYFLDWSKDLAVSEPDLNKILEYMSTSSFISAWYHLSGNKTQRDIAAQSCSTLISALGKDPEPVMLKYLEFERFWRRAMKKEGIAPRNLKLWGFIILTIVIIALFVFLS